MTHPHVLELDDATFDTAVLPSELPVLVDFGATWCGPCKALAPIVEALATENAGRLVVAYVDLDASPRLAARYGIRGAPTIAVFRRGERVAQHLGMTTKAGLLELASLA
jgi:thioredoxin 1